MIVKLKDDVAILRYLICRETEVNPSRQKILNLKGKGGKIKIWILLRI